MKCTIVSALGLALFSGNAVAFPAMMMDKLTAPLVERAGETISKRATAAAPQGAGFLPLAPPPFDAKSQYVSNKGKYAFVPPGSGDARGECPGLNAMANHNYLPHNGYATINQFFTACQQVFGMAPDLALFLATYGAVVDGDLTSWSIAGGPHVGIGGSHNNYESDSSPVRADLSQYGSNTRTVMSQFLNLYNRQPNAATANYNLDVLTAFRGERFQESIDKNPYYSYLPFGGILVSQAAFTFIYRFMANKSAEYPEGILNKEVIKSFMAIEGPENNLYWNPGHEKIPDNWYKRNDADQYSILYFNADVLTMATTQPEILSVGCNKGKVDTYSIIDPATLTNGAYTAQQVAKSPLCFALEFGLAELPLLTGLSATVLAPLTKALSPLTSKLNCASIGSVNQSALTACPGFSNYGGPTAPVAPGAIQS